MQNPIFLFLHASNLKVVHAEFDFPVFACKQFKSRACRILIFHFHMYASKKSCMQNSHFPFSHVRFQNCVHVEFSFSDFTCTLPKLRACRISIFRFRMYASKKFTVEGRFHKLHRNGQPRRYGAPTGNSNTP